MHPRRLMPLRVFCCYSHLTGPDGRQDPHYCVGQFVNALKGRRLTGYAYLLVRAGEPRRRIDTSNAADAVTWFGEMASCWLQQQSFGPLVLVPVPDSGCVAPQRPARTLPLAEAVAACVSEAMVWDVLRFDRPMPSAHAAQGSRDAPSLYRHLRVVDVLPAGARVVLVDDVVATGGHLAACATLLRASGADVRAAVCGADANRVAAADPFDHVVRTVPDYMPPAVSAEDTRKLSSAGT